jgi:two-component system OmpR family response regulator
MTEMSTNGGGRILVVDDEPSIVDAVATALRYEGFEVRRRGTGRGAITAVTTSSRISSCSTGCCLTSTAWRSAAGCESAASRPRSCSSPRRTPSRTRSRRCGPVRDDYVTKPFSLAEVVARVQAILRRTAGELLGDVLQFADLTLDEARHEVRRGEVRVDLTATEFSLLRYFLLNPRRVLSKGQILQNVWRYDFGGNSNVVETYVSYLRKKLDALGPPLIRTIRQAGYMLEAEE